MKKILLTLVAMSLVMASFSQNLSRCDGEATLFFRVPAASYWWTGTYVHAWNSSGDLTSWPGVRMEYVGNRHFKIVFHGRTIDNTWNLIFVDAGNTGTNLGYHRTQIPAGNVVAGGVYRQWFSTRDESVTTPILDCSSELSVCQGEQTIFFRNTGNWQNVRIHIWDAPVATGDFPGAHMTHIGNNIFKFTTTETITDSWRAIISDGGHADRRTQTIANWAAGGIFLPNGGRESVLTPVVCIFPPTATIATLPDIGRQGIGQITVTVVGGTNPPFTVDIGGTVTNDVALDDPVVRSNLAAGTYTVTITCSDGLVFSESVVVARVCQGDDRLNLGAFSTSHTNFGLVALGESLTITVNPEYLSPCLGLTPGDHLYVRPFYRFRQSPSGAIYRYIAFTGWGLDAMDEDFRMTFANGVYTFTIDNILELLETGTSDLGAGSIPFASWMTERPMRMGFYFFYSDGNGGYSVIRTSLDFPTAYDDFRVGLTQDYALSFWVHEQGGRTYDGYRHYFVGEDVNFRYQRRIRFDNVWSLDGGNYKRYAVRLYANDANVDEIPSDTVFVGGNHDRPHRLTTAGDFRFEARAVTPGGESWARNIGDDERQYYNVRAHAPIITLSASTARVVENDTITITATIPFVHPNDDIMLTLVLNPNDFTGVSSGDVTITIPSGSRSGTVRIVAVNDNLRTDSYRTATVGATTLFGFGEMVEVNFVLYAPIEIDIEDVDANCPPPPAPIAAGVTVCINTNSAIFTVENYAIFGEPTFTLWTSETAGTEIPLTVSGATPHTYSFVAPTNFTANTTLYIEMQDATLATGCHLSLRGALSISVVEAPSDFTYNSLPASQGVSDGSIEFTPGVRGLGPFTITISGTTITAENTGATPFVGLAAGYHDATITATANPESCRTHTISQIYVEQSACAFPATPTLVMANVCDGFDDVLIEITNHTAGITYRLVSSADDATLLDNLTVDANNRITIPTQAIGYYYLRAVNTALATECQVSTGRVRVLTVHGITVNPQVSFSAAACVGQTVEVTIQNFDANYDYVLYLGNTALTAVSITSATFETPAITADVTFTLRKNSRVNNIPEACSFSTTVIAIVANPLPIVDLIATDSTCLVAGTITVMVSAGTPNAGNEFDIRLSSSDTPNWRLSGHVFEDMRAGSHTIVVRDDRGCVGTNSVTVAANAAPPVFTATMAYADTNGNNTGRISVTINAGGSGPFDVYISGEGLDNVLIGSNISVGGSVARGDLAAGTYTIRVVGANRCSATQNVVVRMACTGDLAVNTVSLPNIAVLSDRLVITIDVNDLSPCLEFVSGENLYVHPFYVYNQNPTTPTNPTTIPFKSWGQSVLTFRMDYNAGTYTFEIPNIREFIQDYSISAVAGWMFDRPVYMGFLFYTEGATTVIRTQAGLTTGGDFLVPLRQDYAVSLWVHEQSGRTDNDDVRHYFVGENLNLKYDRLLRFDNAWTMDVGNLKTYPIYLLMNGTDVETIPADADFVGGEYVRPRELTDAGTFVFTARAETAVSHRMASNPWVANNPLVSHTIRVHAPIVTLSANPTTVLENDTVTITATLPFAHPDAITVGLLLDDSDFIGVGHVSTLTIPAGQMSGTIELVAVDDGEKTDTYRIATIGITAVTGLAGVTFELYEILEIYIDDIGTECIFPTAPALTMAEVYVDFDEDILVTITNHQAGITYRLVSSADVILLDDIEVDSDNRITIPMQTVGHYYLRALDRSLEDECQVSQGRTRVLTVHAAPPPPPPTYGEGPAGVYLSLNQTEQRFNLNDTTWGQGAGDMGGAQRLEGAAFGAVDELTFTWARARAWAAGDACDVLWDRFAVFYRVTNIENPNTAWIPVLLNHCNDAIYTGDNVRLRTQPNTASNPFQPVDLRAIAYALGGYGTYTLEMAMVFYAGSHAMTTPPADLIRTATFTLVEPAPLPLAIVDRTPAISATNVALNAPVTVTFNQDIALNTPHGIVISGATVTSASATGNVLTIVHEGFTYGTQHSVAIPAAAIDGLTTPIGWSFTTVASTRVQDLETDGFAVFPNPVVDRLYIVHNWQLGDVIELFDMNGQRVFYMHVETLHATSPQNTISIDLSHLPSGTYLLRVGSRVVRIVKR